MPDAWPEGVWTSDALAARMARGALVPASWVYATVVAFRNLAYDQRWLRARPLALPAVAIGNLTVGGTGKTPVAALVAARLAALGARPALVMRGYGADEALVHERLSPGVPVVTGADRVGSVERARALGATIAVLDDGFQHRGARRDADIVLLSADRAGPVRHLPAGPWREPLSALARASLIVVTRKSASPLRARELLAQAMRHAPEAGGATIHLAAHELVAWASDERRHPATLAGARVLAAAAIGDPRSFGAQLTEFGARVELAGERDHHAYSAADAAALARRAHAFDIIVCTLKDAVKLGPIWPADAPPLWYLSQRLAVESGADRLDRLLAALAAKT
jgi:tetraacyldisaccharide 4'-kinase